MSLKNSSKILQRSAGFSLPEILLALGCMTILALVLSNLSSFQRIQDDRARELADFNSMLNETVTSTRKQKLCSQVFGIFSGGAAPTIDPVIGHQTSLTIYKSDATGKYTVPYLVGVPTPVQNNVGLWHYYGVKFSSQSGTSSTKTKNGHTMVNGALTIKARRLRSGALNPNDDRAMTLSIPMTFELDPTNLAVSCASSDPGDISPSRLPACVVGQTLAFDPVAQQWTCNDSSLPVAAINGLCGPANGNSYNNGFDVVAAGQCVAGIPVQIAALVGPWNWACEGLSGGISTPGPICHASVLGCYSGACGTANGATYPDAASIDPTTLCTLGLATPAPGGAGPWSWQCLGNGCGNVVCTANNTATPGACGSANGNSYPTAAAVNGAGLCQAPSVPATAVSGSGPWTWNCYGTDGGIIAACSASTTAVVNGACGPANGGIYPNAWTVNATGLCSSPGAGTPVPATLSGVASTWTWSCAGANGGANSGVCTANSYGRCGPANGGAYPDIASATVGGLCNSGTPSPVTGTGSFTWTCSNGGPDPGDACATIPMTCPTTTYVACPGPASAFNYQIITECDATVSYDGLANGECSLCTCQGTENFCNFSSNKGYFIDRHANSNTSVRSYCEHTANTNQFAGTCNGEEYWSNPDFAWSCP